MRSYSRLLCLLALSLVLGACAVSDRSGSDVKLEATARWALLPFSNHTETPQAGQRAESILQPLLRARGVHQLELYPAKLDNDGLFESNERAQREQALAWAREQGARYALYGAVDEWRYKVGVDGEPAVGLSLAVVDAQSGKVLWSAVGARSGWSRESLAGVAQKLLRDLLGGAHIE